MCAKFEVIDTRKEVDSRKLGKRTRPRKTICPITDYRAAARRPGQRMVTTDEIRKMLEDMP